MTDEVRSGFDGETPVNPYSLLEAVNDSSDAVHMGWLVFIAIMAYLMIAVAGVTHKDLLLQTPVELPILQVRIQQAQFFQFAPVLLVLFHIGIVSQLVLLARKTLEFDIAVRALETSERRTHPLRLELGNFFFVQAIAGPQRSLVMSAFLHGISWLTLVALPVVLLLFIQISFLPYHDVAVTWTHRIALLVDIVMLILIGVFLTRAETSFLRAFWRTGRQHPLGFIFTALVLTAVALFSLFVATVPGERMDRLGQFVRGGGDPAFARGDADPGLRFGFALPFVESSPDGSLFGVLHRNLIVTDTDLVADTEAESADASISLRGRDLRYARLDRSDLHKADLTGADLSGASLVGADLRKVRLQCTDVNAVVLNRDAARCAEARGANFTRAQLSGARLIGIDLTDARLEEANLEGAELTYSILTGANFVSARLEKADVTGGAQAQGANFLLASLQGADFTGAQLQGADFTSAAMQGVTMSHAQLQGAVLRDADLEGAELSRVMLHGADMTGAKLLAADLRGSVVWQTPPPAQDAMTLADLSDLGFRPIEDAERASLEAMIAGIANERVKEQVSEALAATMAPNSRLWANSPEGRRWQTLAAAGARSPSDAYRNQLTEYLVKMMCKSRWASGSVATGVVKRALGADFRGDMPGIHDRLKTKECPASETLSRKVVQNLSLAVDTVRGN